MLRIVRGAGKPHELFGQTQNTIEVAANSSMSTDTGRRSSSQMISGYLMNSTIVESGSKYLEH